MTSESTTTIPTNSNEPIIKPVDDWKVTIDGENVALPDTGDSQGLYTNYKKWISSIIPKSNNSFLICTIKIDPK